MILLCNIDNIIVYISKTINKCSTWFVVKLELVSALKKKLIRSLSGFGHLGIPGQVERGLMGLA